jgi:hypothetical protein
MPLPTGSENMSWYQALKPVLLELLGLTKDAIHIHVGFFSLVLVLIVSKLKLSSWKILIPGFCLSLLMEIHDLRDDYVYGEALHFSASLHDLINTNLIPLVLVLMAKSKKISI